MKTTNTTTAADYCPDLERVTVNQLKASTPRPVVVTYKGHEFTLIDSDSWVEYRVIDSDGCGHDVNSIAEVKDWIRMHVAAWEELNAEPLVITRERKGRVRIASEQFTDLHQAKAALQDMYTRAIDNDITAYIQADSLVLRVDHKHLPNTYYRIEPASYHA